jgi:hypothetical protein
MKTYQFMTELMGFKPRMWRRIQVSGDVTVTELSFAVMSTFKVMGGHLWNFEFMGMKNRANDHGRMFMYADGFNDFDDEDPDTVTAAEIFKQPKDRAFINYDMGDDWLFKVSLEAILTDTVDSAELPRVLKGKGRGIHEDCGGAWRLSEEWDEEEDNEFDVEEVTEDMRSNFLASCYSERSAESKRVRKSAEYKKTLRSRDPKVEIEKMLSSMFAPSLLSLFPKSKRTENDIQK